MITRARALATGLAALGLLVLLVAGLPVILLRFGGSPLPQDIGGWHAIGAALSRPDNGTILLGIVRELSWLGWLLFTTSVITEAQAAVRGRRSPHLRLGGLQGAAAHLVALAALAFAAPSAITLSASVTTASGQAASGQAASAQAAGGHGGDASAPDCRRCALSQHAAGHGRLGPGRCWRITGSGRRTGGAGHGLRIRSGYRDPAHHRPGW